MIIQTAPIDKIKPYANNPRHNETAVDAVAASLEQFGWQQPIVVDKKGVVIVGHTRLLAAKKLGMTEVPIKVADLPPDKAKAYRLADNRVGEIATWDEGKLGQELRELQALNFSIEGLGWTPEELGALTAPEGTAGLQAPDEVPKAPNPKDVKTRRGDVWTLGRHRLMCGSSTDPKDVEKLMDGKKAAICATDPPYLVDYTGVKPVEDGKGGYKPGGKDWSDTYREIEIKDAEGFFRSLFTNVRDVLAPQAAIYVWHAHKRVGLIQRLWEELEILDHQQIIWVKPTPVFGRCFWHFRHEPCMMGWRRGDGPRHDGVHDIDSVWRVGFDTERSRKIKVAAAETDVWEVDWEGKARVVGNEHPTQKPVELFARPMRRHTKPGAICFEPFSGSGSQLIAAEQTGRTCYAMELEPVFVEVAIRRWEAFTGQKGVRTPAAAPAPAKRRKAAKA